MDNKVKFYHFTGVPMLHGILSSTGINQGYIQLSNNKMLHGYPWVTTSPLPYGHGLFNGTEKLSQKQISFMKQAGNLTKDTKIRGTHNKRLIRITIDGNWIKNQVGFISYIKLMKELKEPKEPKELIKITGIEGWVDIDTLSDKELMQWMKNEKTREKTWYVFNGTIPSEKFLAVDFMISEHNYVSYNFEIHGRKIMENSGLYSISEKNLISLNEIVSEKYIPGAICIFCQKNTSTPSIILRNKKFNALISLEDTNCINILGNKEVFNVDKKNISLWINDNKDMLYNIWDKAKENYLFHSRND